MNTQEIQLTRDIMLRVRLVYFMRLFLKPVPLKSVVLVVSVVSATFLVSIPNIIGNMSHLPSMQEGANYLAFAFTHTSLVVESVIVLAFLAGGLLAYDIGRNVKYLKYVRFSKREVSQG